MNRTHGQPGDLLSRLYDYTTRMHSWSAAAVCLVAGLVGNLGFAPLHLWPATCLALLTLIWMLDGAARTRAPFLTRWVRAGLFALGLIGGGWSWLGATLAVAGDDLGVLWLALFVVMQAGVWGVVIAAFALFWRTGPARIGLFCLAMYTAEWLRAAFFGGLVWNPLALVWAPGQSVSQLASLIGVGGLSALTILMFTAPTAMIDRTSRSLAMRVSPIILVGACLGLLWGWGAQRLHDGAAAQLHADRSPHRLLLVDASASAPEDALQAYLSASVSPDTGAPDEDVRGGTSEIVIWPERATPHYLFQSTRYIDPIAQILGNRSLIAGAIRTQPLGTASGESSQFNALAVMSADSVMHGPLAIHDASRLMPILDYLLLRPKLFTVGLSPVPVRAPGIAPFVPLIGAEAMVSANVPGGDDRPEWLVNLANETDTGHLFARDQSFALSRYRSIELGLPMARVSAGGNSAVIDGFGRIVARVQPVRKDPASVGSQGRGQSVALPPSLSETRFSAGWGKRFVLFFAVFNLSLFAWTRG